MRDLNYCSRLAALGIETLELRRLKQDLIATYKILFGLIDINLNELFTFSNTSYDTGGHAYKLLQGQCRIDTRKHYFTERVVKIWNCLPIKDCNLGSVKVFSNFFFR